MFNLFKITGIGVYTLASCTNAGTDLSRAKTIDLNQGFSNRKTMYLSEVATDLEYIQLETKDESLIHSVSKVLVHNNRVIVLDKKQQIVLVFDKSGKYIGKIGNYGRGPGEYLGIADIAIRRRDSTLCLYDDQTSKIIIYSMQGRLKSETRTPFNADKAAFLNDSILCLLAPRPNFVNNNSYSIALYDSRMNLCGRLIDRSHEDITVRLAQFMPSSSMNCLEKQADTLSYWEVKYDIVYRIIDRTTVIPAYHLKYDGKIPLDEGFSSQTAERYASVEILLETKSYFFLQGINSGNFFRMVYDKTKRMATSTYFDFQDYDMAHRMLNDIDGGYPFWPTGTLEDGRVYSAVHLYSFREYAGKKPFCDIISKKSDEALAFSTMVAKSDFVDNPCLMIVRMK